MVKNGKRERMAETDNEAIWLNRSSLQERATKISHGNTAAHASRDGDKHLGKICAAIAGDEARHEKAYIKIVDELFRL